MLSVLFAVLPIFALILAGWLARQLGALSPHATTEINRFVVYLALPALLFDIVANAQWDTLWQPAFVAAFGLGAAAVFVLGVALGLWRSRHLADAAIDGLNAAYANTGFIGIPLGLAVLGRDALVPALIATIITVCILFAVAVIVVEVALQSKGRPGRMLAKVSGQLLRNPLLVAPVLGAIVLASGIGVPAPAEAFLKLLGNAASPCALVSLGLFLAERRAGPDRSLKGLPMLVGLKLVAQPLATWLLASKVFGLPMALTHSAVLMAALPTGTGPFMATQYYGREASITSAAILVSTVLSVVTITGYLGWAG